MVVVAAPGAAIAQARPAQESREHAFIAKPFTPDALAARVRDVLDAERPAVLPAAAVLSSVGD